MTESEVKEELLTTINFTSSKARELANKDGCGLSGYEMLARTIESCARAYALVTGNQDPQK